METCNYTPLGVLADVCLYEIKNHTDNIELGNYIVMPNHIHLILIINQTSNEASAEKPSINQKMASISPKAGSVSTIIRSYKAAVSRHANRLGYTFKWQTRFHDHIIRDERAFKKLSEYIINNPQTWEIDKFYTPQPP